MSGYVILGQVISGNAGYLRLCQVKSR